MIRLSQETRLLAALVLRDSTWDWHEWGTSWLENLLEGTGSGRCHRVKAMLFGEVSFLGYLARIVDRGLLCTQRRHQTLMHFLAISRPKVVFLSHQVFIVEVNAIVRVDNLLVTWTLNRATLVLSYLSALDQWNRLFVTFEWYASLMTTTRDTNYLSHIILYLTPRALTIIPYLVHILTADCFGRVPSQRLGLLLRGERTNTLSLTIWKLLMLLHGYGSLMLDGFLLACRLVARSRLVTGTFGLRHYSSWWRLESRLLGLLHGDSFHRGEVWRISVSHRDATSGYNLLHHIASLAVHYVDCLCRWFATRCASETRWRPRISCLCFPCWHTCLLARCRLLLLLLFDKCEGHCCIVSLHLKCIDLV